jgi:hypothetical protein
MWSYATLWPLERVKEIFFPFRFPLFPRLFVDSRDLVVPSRAEVGKDAIALRFCIDDERSKASPINPVPKG